HATVHVVITGANDAPHAPDHDVTSGLWTIPGQKLVVSADQGLLAGVTDPDDGPGGLTAFGKGLSHYGATVTVHADGSFEYDPTNSAAIHSLTANGSDLVGTFHFRAPDAPGAVHDPTVTVVVKGTVSPYRYDVIASTGQGFQKLGQGPSINNHGFVGFQGSKNNQDSLYIYGNKQNDDGSFKPSQTFSIIKEAFLKFLVPNNDPNSIPNSRIDSHVQI